jgi:hypothetical protein
MWDGLEGFIKALIFFATLGVIVIVLAIGLAAIYGLSLLIPFISQFFEYR